MNRSTLLLCLVIALTGCEVGSRDGDAGTGDGGGLIMGMCADGTDSDGDGIFDRLETSSDFDGDGILEVLTESDGLPLRVFDVDIKAEKRFQ